MSESVPKEIKYCQSQGRNYQQGEDTEDWQDKVPKPLLRMWQTQQECNVSF